MRSCFNNKHDINVIYLRRSALNLGILYLAFEAFPIIFQDGHHFNDQCTGMSFLGIGLGMLIALATQPLWNRYAFLRDWKPMQRRLTSVSASTPEKTRSTAADLPPKCVSSSACPAQSSSPSVRPSHLNKISHIPNIILNLSRPLLPRLHKLALRPLDRAHPRHHPLRHGNRVLLHVRLHVPRRRVPAHRRVRDGGEQLRALCVCGGVPAACAGDVWEAGDGRRDGASCGVGYVGGAFAVSFRFQVNDFERKVADCLMMIGSCSTSMGPSYGRSRISPRRRLLCVARLSVLLGGYISCGPCGQVPWYSAEWWNPAILTGGK